ncbi:MAG: hypothetical protein H0W02_10240 [Ktedonobacteraceae bacterium]|nr:hypothetical protein [Ktedonobacteraceae bacterium]
MKLAIIDLAGPIADESKRFELARTPAGMNWQVFFDPQHLHLDTLVEGADAAIATLRSQGYAVLLMTSRPESMREATVSWCLSHQILFGMCAASPAMKPPGAQFLRTTQLKAIMVQMLAGVFAATEVVVVEDEAINLTEILDYDTSYHLRGFSSLADCMAWCHPESEAVGQDDDGEASPF